MRYPTLKPVLVGISGAALACAFLVSAPLSARAATPASDDIASLLTREAQGVIGSGDRLSLRVLQDGAIRTINLGEPYRDGWTLQALSATEARLTRGDATVRVGLNPTGDLALSLPASPATTVTIVGDRPDAATMALAVKNSEIRMGPESMARNKQAAAAAGLTPDEIDRMMAYSQLGSEVIVARIQASPRGSPVPSPTSPEMAGDMQRAMGVGGYQEWLALGAKLQAGAPTPPAGPGR